MQEREKQRAIDLPSEEQQDTETTDTGSPTLRGTTQDLELDETAELIPVLPTTTTCVWCLEEVKVGARVCKHCGRDPNEDSP